MSEDFSNINIEAMALLTVLISKKAQKEFKNNEIDTRYLLKVMYFTEMYSKNSFGGSSFLTNQKDKMLIVDLFKKMALVIKEDGLNHDRRKEVWLTYVKPIRVDKNGHCYISHTDIGDHSVKEKWFNKQYLKLIISSEKAWDKHLEDLQWNNISKQVLV